jgi:hypothetical protein
MNVTNRRNRRTNEMTSENIQSPNWTGRLKSLLLVGKQRYEHGLIGWIN